jgi:glycosyltransferase involved in cell wall biosynthesis
MDNAQVAPDRRAAVRQQLKFDEHDVVVMALPPVARQAGTFVAAWATLLLEKAHPVVRLIVPADGTEADRVRRLVVSCRHEQVVRFTAPEVPLRDVLAASDLAVYLPPQDAPSTGLVAAMAAGCPIVAASVPTVTELLVAGESAWLCRPGDPQDAARQMLRAIENMEQSRWQAEHAHRLAATFSPARMLAEYARVYRNLATRRPASAA